VEWLVTRETVITLAVLGAVLSTAASALQVRGKIGAARARQLNLAGYVAMGISMLLFIIAGYRS
jgi:predicted membrane channel-forming protein YqfA (hemolysin III family)